MALQGTLRDFSITEIIQLIGQQLKTGVLSIRRGKKLVQIYFVEGNIVHVYSNYRGRKDLIGEILVKGGLITEDQLERALRIQKGTVKYLGEILVELQLLNKEDVLRVITTQVYETIYDLFWWEDGTFNFDLKLVESYKKIPFALSAEQVLLNILRMVDEWSEIEKKIYSPHLVFRKSSSSNRISLGALSPQTYLKEKMTSEQELVYRLVDGDRTVEEIIDRSLLGKFNTCEILNSLLEIGLIEVAGIRTPSIVKKVSGVNLRDALRYGSYGGFVLVVILLLLYFRPDFIRPLLGMSIEAVDIGKPAHLVEIGRIQQIRNALEVYYIENGRYPEGLDELISAGLIRKEDLSPGRSPRIQYQLKDGKYSLKH